ncbi:hypothetical protein QNA08_06660 [Chelatococcus sp. SYSU_G07232]|uniref:Uncharacterized protein n=1 Tax=Chelatococcus albus TaxID=3047466 RepID=A0ABT7AEY7_9HYPH|nr:hypothetical protein [Chelatococcus sp. SYSU_G07232]MDJ1157913.1 hypothetical protein [Chelatococcus sp. SYSU_G07232]
MLLLLIVCAGLYAWLLHATDTPGRDPVNGVGVFTGLVAAIATAAVAGGLLGFLFALPQRLMHEETESAAAGATGDMSEGAKAPIDGGGPQGPASRAGRATRPRRIGADLQALSAWLMRSVICLCLIQVALIYIRYAETAAEVARRVTGGTARGGTVLVLLSLGALVCGFLLVHRSARQDPSRALRLAETTALPAPVPPDVQGEPAPANLVDLARARSDGRRAALRIVVLEDRAAGLPAGAGQAPRMPGASGSAWEHDGGRDLLSSPPVATTSKPGDLDDPFRPLDRRRRDNLREAKAILASLRR